MAISITAQCRVPSNSHLKELPAGYSKEVYLILAKSDILEFESLKLNKKKSGQGFETLA